MRDLRLVSISLGDEDDAQVIFETLNGHGAELHATDLVRNFIFMRADRDGADGHKLFETYWTEFETSFWAEQQRRGRLLKPRMEWFLQAALQAALGEEVEIGRLYAEYRNFALPKGTPIKARAQYRSNQGNGMQVAPGQVDYILSCLTINRRRCRGKNTSVSLSVVAAALSRNRRRSGFGHGFAASVSRGRGRIRIDAQRERGADCQWTAPRS